MVVADLEQDPVAIVLRLNPDVIAFSITTAEFPFMKDMGTRLRASSDKIIICGGCHATFCPDVINEPYLDAVCIGEGDKAFPEFIEALASGNSLETIKNIWTKKEGRVFKNDVRPLIDDLDSLPFYDREIYLRYPLYAKKGREVLYHLVVNAGRGCPKSCSFCFNKSYNNLYEGKGSIVRRRSVDHLITELKNLKHSANVRFITLDDDSFTLAPREWLHDFCAAYKKEIGIPFKINSTPTALDEDRIKCLKNAGCFAVKMGIESGNQTVRNRILKKNLKEESIVEAARLLKAHGLRFQTFNIVGSPGENIDMAFETYALNRRIRPDFTWCSLLNPYPGTDIYELCIKDDLMLGENGLENKISFYFTGSPLVLPHKRELVNLQKLMNFAVRLNLSERTLHALVKLPLSKLYSMIFGAGIAWGMIRINKGSFWSVIWLSLRYFSRYNNEKVNDEGICNEPVELTERNLIENNINIVNPPNTSS